MSIPPFVNVRGKPYLVVNYDLGGQSINLKAHLDALLDHHAPADILLLRPLSPGEADLLRQADRDATVEAWAGMIVKEEDRARARR